LGAKRFRLRRPALLARLPKLLWRPGKDWPVVPKERAAYGTLDADLAIWDRAFEGRFRDLDHRALRLQNRFWLLHLLLIFGSASASILGAVQASIGSGNVWLATFGAVLSGLLAGVAVLIRDRPAQRAYLNARLKAERIKSEYFLFLARVGDYAADPERLRILEERVVEIEHAEGLG
jgi:Protein of unknown function (DUF4231)